MVQGSFLFIKDNRSPESPVAAQLRREQFNRFPAVRIAQQLLAQFVPRIAVRWPVVGEQVGQANKVLRGIAGHGATVSRRTDLAVAAAAVQKREPAIARPAARSTLP